MLCSFEDDVIQGIIQQNTYLVWSLMLLAVFIVFFLITPDQRRLMLLASLCSTPYAIASLVFVPEYWAPVRVSNLAVGIEDLLFSFANGGIVWWFAVVRSRNQIQVDINPSRSFWRYWHCSGFGTTVAVGLWLLGVGIMLAFWVSMVLLFCFFLIKKPWYWRLSLAGAVGFSAVYYVLAFVIFLLNPEFATQWSLENLSGHTLWIIPIEEFVWAFGYGAVFPMILAFAFRAKLRTVAPRENQNRVEIRV